MNEERYERLYDASWDELQETGSRIVELERHFNNKRGMNRADDEALPYELDGLADELSNYYQLRGWNDDGTVPDTDVEGAVSADD